ncbi:MAG: hypothetical protein FWF05_02155 [Oscillospiraceae bacterium]|nr:hypothetical protein [Oscillospiraceae bacterium]
MKIKKALSLLLAPVLFTAFGPAALAFEDKTYKRQEEHTPVILVPGFTSPPLYMNYGKEDEKKVWMLNLDEVKAAILNNIADFGIALGALTVGKIDRLAEVLGQEALKILKPITIKPDGSSVCELTPGFNTPEKSNNRWLLDNMDGKFIAEPDIAGGIAEIIGAENVFNFYCDFRQGSVKCAKDLRAFVEQVKAYTNSDKVSILAISHGGQTAGTYLSMFGTMGDLDNVVMNAPALGGAAFAYDAMSGALKVDEKLLIYYIECGLVSETNYEWLMNASKLGFLDRLLNKVAQEYLTEVALYWGSIWDFIPTEHYEEMKARFLDPVEHAWLIESSDYMHYTVMANYGKSFDAARKAGVNVSIMANTGAKAVTGSVVNSDAIIPTASSSGAFCAPYGKRFADGYTGTGGSCKNPAHHHISPSMEVDATHCYLPENTWFVEGQFHGMSYWDPYSRVLTRKLLLTDEITDIYSDPAYPQFGLTHNAQDALYIEFDKSPQGFVTNDDKFLRIYNLSEKYSVKIMSINCDGMDIAFSPLSLRRIAPGSSAEIKFSGHIPDAHIKRASVTVNFLQIGALSMFDSRTFHYTVLDGKRISFNGEAPLADVGFREDYGNAALNFFSRLFSFFGLRDSFRTLVARN